MHDPWTTHEVFNQPPLLQGFDAYAQDAALREAVARHGAGWAEGRLRGFGRYVADARTQHSARLANLHVPMLHSHDRHGRRIDEVEYHPAYHELLARGVAEQLHAMPFARPRPGAHVVRAALCFLHNFAEIGVLCPITMTFAAVPALRAAPAVAAHWEPRILSDTYDARPFPPAKKTGVTVGMAMTEKQGGSDVRANTTRARSDGAGGWLLTGHKWFCSAPMSDAFLTLAQTDAGLTCFLVPRFTPDGARNVFLVQRLKDKLGNRSNASAEIEWRDTWAELIGEEGRGIATIMEMVHHTRLDTAISAAGIMRAAVARATHHAAHRRAFGDLLADLPAMRRVLADLAIESEAATALAMRLAAAFDVREEAFSRLAVPISKFWLCKRAPGVVAEALEVHGGNGYVETGEMARLYREAPLNGIWEGTGTVMALDALRAIARTPGALDAVIAEIELAKGGDRRLDAHMARLTRRLAAGTLAADARRIAVDLAVALQASLLVRHAPGFVADAHCASRLDGAGSPTFGMLPDGLGESKIVERATPRYDAAA